VSIIIPCRNEERYIGKCLDSLIEQDFSKEQFEILIIDGMSDDGTEEILKKYEKEYQFVRIYKNIHRITPMAMNEGLKKSKGNLISFINAHSILDKNFLKNSVKYLEKTDAVAVGGTLRTINDDTSYVAQAIPLAADSVFGAGGKRYRSKSTESWVKDTLPYCVYKKTVFKEIGLIDEELIRGQDAEFNYRILKKYGKIYYTPEIKSNLHIRPSLGKLRRQHFQYGYFRPLIFKKVRLSLLPIQTIPAIFIGVLTISLLISIFFISFLWVFLFVLGIYLIFNILFSLVISIRKGIKYFIILPVCFVTLHFSYGVGYIKGALDFNILKRHRRKKIKEFSITR
jgi:glycosyltransferase involved in cell wall biosynthesis